MNKNNITVSSKYFADLRTRKCRNISFQTVFMILSLYMVSIPAWAGYEPYREQGHALSKELFTILIAESMCSDGQDCNNKELLLGEHGNRVNLHFYGVNDPGVIAKIVSVVAEKGLRITNGAPITIRFYKKTKKELLGFKSFFAESSITLEINE